VIISVGGLSAVFYVGASGRRGVGAAGLRGCCRAARQARYLSHGCRVVHQSSCSCRGTSSEDYLEQNVAAAGIQLPDKEHDELNSLKY
jgi:hypothetical protein